MSTKMWSVRQVVSGDRFSYIAMWVLLPKLCGVSGQVVSHGSGLPRQFSLLSHNLKALEETDFHYFVALFKITQLQSL